MNCCPNCANGTKKCASGPELYSPVDSFTNGNYGAAPLPGLQPPQNNRKARYDAGWTLLEGLVINEVHGVDPKLPIRFQLP